MSTNQCIDLSEENSKILQDFRYFADNAPPEKRSSFEASLKSFAASLISPVSIPFSPSAQKPVSELGGSGAGLVGNPDCAPVTMSGDAWESAAHHVISIRQKQLSNADTWRQIGEFLSSLPQKAPEPCLFPQPFHRKNDYLIGTGTEPLLPRGHCELREEFGIVATIDAPNLLPRGGSISGRRFGSFDGSTFEGVTCSRGRS